MSWWSDDTSSDPFDYDDSEIRERPNRHGSRPRTKNRPEHADAVTGMIIAVDRGRFTVLVPAPSTTPAYTPPADTPADTSPDASDPDIETTIVTASRARELGKKAVVNGDRVDLVGDVTGEPGTLARIVRVQERSTILRRSADDTDAVERVIVANADQLLIVVAAANPEPRLRLVDRYLVAAFDAGIKPILCITKTDVADPTEFLSNFAGLDVPVFLSATDNVPLDALQRALAGHSTVAVGHSGVGKSTLVNVLVPGAHRAIGHVNEVTGRGRHTSSSTVTLKLESPYGSGWVIDTPGVRSFGLGHVNPENILGSFTDLAALADKCPRGCTHLPDSPDCAMIEAVEAGALGAAGAGRLDSLQRLLTTFADKGSHTVSKSDSERRIEAAPMPPAE
jgi:ribosome biogenesis GTPase